MYYFLLILFIHSGLSNIQGKNSVVDIFNFLDEDPTTRNRIARRSPNELFSTNDENLPIGKCEDMEENIPLRLSNVELKNINAGFIDSPYISCLSLDGNMIDNLVPGAFNNLPNLMYLDLSRNQIPTNSLMPVDTFEKLTTLILDENIPSDSNRLSPRGHLSVTGYFPKLKYLYLRKNGITHISLSFTQNIPNLSHLYLSENAIGDNILDFASNMPNSLTHVYLERNGIKRIFDWQLLYLVSLFLDGNNIRTLCYKICDPSSLSLKFASNLETLSISHNNLETIDPKAFDDTVNLLSLDLSHNAIKTIPEGTFNHTVRLVNLSLDHNLLTSIPDLSTMYNITNLHLNDNYITIISSGAFSNLSYLTNVTLNNNLIYYVESLAFSNLPMLMELDLSNNSLYDLPLNWMLPQMNFRNLYLNMNKFESLNEIALTDIWSLEGLYIYGNPLKFLSMKSLKNLPENITLYLQHDCKVPEPISTWDREKCNMQCQHLCQHNHIMHTTGSTVSSDFGNELHHGQSLEVAGYFPQLKYLYLRKNKITKILPRFAENLPNLTHLFLSDNAIGNRILDFENNLPNSLTHVYLQRNEIEHIDDWQLLHLKSLFLDGNKIRMLCYKKCGDFSLSLKFAWKLETLSISHNGLETIESNTFDDTVNLLSLNLSYNAIRTIGEGTFGQTVRLANLSLDHNLLTSIPDLSTMYNITNLHLNDNFIRNISRGAFSNLSYLTSVTLNNNLIEHVEPLAFFNLPMLMELDLSYNSLHHLPFDWMSPQMNLRNLYLNMNKNE